MSSSSTNALRSQSEQKNANPGVSYSIDVKNISKSFRRTGKRPAGYSTLKSGLLACFSKRTCVDTHATHALSEVTLRIPKGNSVGIIGRNGSGKSTLLKLLTGIYKPDSGRVTLNGRVAALIELGAGFHPDFTGRENLYLSAIMYGLSKKEVDKRFNEIVAFAELADFIDEPVRTYSSGMFMRLGFSIAIHTDPDILLVDEVLAVGDTAFVSKCKDRISLLHKRGTTLLLVTHDLDAVERWCDEAIWLHEGVVKDRGFPRRVIDSYRHFVERDEERKALLPEESVVVPVAIDTEEPVQSADEVLRWGSREVEIVSVELVGSDNAARRVLHPDESVTIEIMCEQHVTQADLVFGIGINRIDGLVVYGSNTDIERIALPALLDKKIRVQFCVARLSLLEGAYEIDVAVHRKDGHPFDYHKRAVQFSVRSDAKEVGVFSPPHNWLIHGAESNS